MSHGRGCPCGRESWDYNLCTEKNCYKKNDTEERTMIKQKEQMKYVWVQSNGSISLIDDPVRVYHYDEFDKEGDKIYQLGSEVEVQVTVAVKNKTVYRSGLKDDLGVGDYRG